MAPALRTARTSRSGRLLADASVGALLAEIVLTVLAYPRTGLPEQVLLNDGLVVSNAVLGAFLVLAGYPVARTRPDHPVGWLLVVAGVGYAFSACGFVTMAWLTEPGEDAFGWRLVAFLTSIGWTLVIGILMPAALLLFADGRFARGLFWQVGSVLALVGGGLFALRNSLAPQHLGSGLGVDNLVLWRGATDLGGLGGAADAWFGLLYPFCVVVLVVRYRRGADRERRQVLWLLLGTLVMTTCFFVSALAFPNSWLGIVPVAAVPAAVAIAILREDLFDIRQATARTVLYLLLTGLAVATYAGVVAGTATTLSAHSSRGASVVAVLTVAVGFNPARAYLQRRLDRLFYGARRDPAQAMAAIVGRLDEPHLETVLAAVCDVLRLPWATIEVHGQTIAQFGQVAVPEGQEFPLGGAGLLRIGARPGEARLGSRDLEILGPVARSLAVAVRAERTADELRTARSGLVAAREEERRRVGRELHDRVGSALAALSLTADAARRTDRRDARGGELLTDLGRQVRDVTEEVRRLARGLRPPILDSLGLVGALQEQARMFAPLQVEVEADGLPDLTAALDVAAYLIVSEALTNVVRHARADRAWVRLTAGQGCVTVVIDDDGSEQHPWASGVGLSSMAERAVELGGTFRAGPRPDGTGGRVEARLPWGDEW